MTAELLVALLFGLLVVVAVASLLFWTANRLHRLHIRADAAWAALDAALARRAVVARVVAAESGADAVRRAADAAEAADRPGREDAENRLTELLSTVDRRPLSVQVRDELADAEHRVVIARRVHNDAIRDTLALRRRRKVRYLRLAGNAPYPEYFEIVEPELEQES